MWVYLWKEGLPSEYQEVEYIQSSGTQWIDTWVIPTQNTKSQMKVLFVDYTWDVVYWMYNWNDNADYRLINKYNNNTQIWKCIFDFWTQRIMSSSAVFSTGTAYELEIWNYYVKDLSSWTNLVSWTTISSYTGSRTITLNNYNNSTYSKNRWYYVKIYENWALVRDFIPCYRKSDNVIWMYDLVNNQFYTNSWSWAFTKGSNVSYTGLIQKEIYPGHKGFVPWVNTRIYLPLTDNYKDVVSWTTLSTTWAVSLVTEWWVKCTRVNWWRLYWLSSAMITWSWSRTLSFWFKYNSISSSEWWTAVCRWSESNYSFYSLWDNTGVNYAFSWYSSSADIESSTTLSTWVRYNMVATYDWSTVSIYLNWTFIWSKSVGLSTWSSDLYIWWRPGWSCLANWYVSQVIVENKVWTAQEITDYYNMTKSDFGI